MTRINVIPVKELSRQHLIAEYREIMRLPNNLRKSLASKTPIVIPSQYVLGKGHVKFFYNKMAFLKKRFEQLVDEMINRGYNPTYTDSSMFVMGEEWDNDYMPDNKAFDINRERIRLRS